MQLVLRSRVQQGVRRGRERGRCDGCGDAPVGVGAVRGSGGRGQCPGVHGRGQQTHARDVVDRIPVGQRARQRLTRLLSGQFVVRHEHGGGDGRVDRIVDGVEPAMQRFAAGDRHGADAFGGGEIPGYGQSAEYGRRHVVRMPFDGGGQVEDGRTVELALLREGGRRRDAGHDRLGGGAHAARLRDAVVRLKREAEPPQAEGAAGATEGGDHQMGFVARQRLCALPLDVHVRIGVRRIVAQREGELVVVVERQADRVEAGAEVRAGGGDTDVYATCHRIHDMLLTRVGVGWFQDRW